MNSTQLTQAIRRSLSIEGQTYLIAWSGGVDSTVLVHLFQRLQKSHPFEFAAAHVRHGLRKSDEFDQRFCRKWARRWGITLFSTSLNLERENHSIQLEARRRRYGYLAYIASRINADVVLTAHHFNDWLETAVMKARRGTDLRGLTGLSNSTDYPLPEKNDLEIRRPFLNVFSRQIREYANQHELTWVEDPTNSDTKYERNRIRREVIPGLIQKDKKADSLKRTLQNLGNNQKAIEDYANELIRDRVLFESTHTIRLDVAQIDEYPRELIPSVLQALVNRLDDAAYLNRKHLERITRRLYGDESAATPLEVTGHRIYCEIHRHQLVLARSRGRGNRWITSPNIHSIDVDLTAVQLPVRVPWFGCRLTFRRHSPRIQEESPRCESFDAASLEPTGLSIRAPGGEDNISPFGLKGTKRVSDLLREAAIPRSLRRIWPILTESTSRILWVSGIRRSARAPITDSTESVVSCEFEPIKSFQISE